MEDTSLVETEENNTYLIPCAAAEFSADYRACAENPVCATAFLLHLRHVSFSCVCYAHPSFCWNTLNPAVSHPMICSDVPNPHFCMFQCQQCDSPCRRCSRSSTAENRPRHQSCLLRGLQRSPPSAGRQRSPPSAGHLYLLRRRPFHPIPRHPMILPALRVLPEPTILPSPTPSLSPTIQSRQFCRRPPRSLATTIVRPSKPSSWWYVLQHLHQHGIFVGCMIE